MQSISSSIEIYSIASLLNVETERKNAYDNTKASQLEPGYADADDLFLVFILGVVDGNCAIMFQYRPQFGFIGPLTVHWGLSGLTM